MIATKWRSALVAGALMAVLGQDVQAADGIESALAGLEQIAESAGKVGAPAARSGAKRALCIGIDDYEDLPNPRIAQGHDLHGAENDARAWKAFLETRGRYQTESLLGRAATRAGILGGIRTLIEEARKGDQLVITYSGHGVQLRDDDGDEPDELDEAIAAQDLVVDGAENVIRDDELEELFQQKREGVRIVFITDCCHSGSMYRPAERTKSKAKMRAGVRNLILTQDRSKKTKKKQPKRRYEHAVIHVAACRDSELASEGDLEGETRGIFSYHALRSLAIGPGNFTAWVDDVLARIDDPDQHPELHGSDEDLEQAPF